MRTRGAWAHAAGETCRNPTWPDLIHSAGRAVGRSVGGAESPLARSGGATKPTQRFSYGWMDVRSYPRLCRQFLSHYRTPKGPRIHHIHIHSDPAGFGLTAKRGCNPNICSPPSSIPLSPLECPCSQSLSRAKIHE